MRMLQLAAHRDDIQTVKIRVHDDVASYLLNKKRGGDQSAGRAARQSDQHRRRRRRVSRNPGIQLLR